jgi:hypothetical protein
LTIPRRNGFTTMIHIYETEGYNDNFFEVYKDVIGQPWNEELLFSLEVEELQEYIDKLTHEGVDFAIHNEEFVEYHLALEKS